MRFVETDLVGVMIVEPELHQDERGFFTRLGCEEEFAAAGIHFTARQTSLSRNMTRHTLRGMHACLEPEAKLVRCTRGKILDVVFDIRRDSSTFGRSFGIELDAESARALYVPAGVAHGFLTLAPRTDVFYQIDRLYRPGFDFGLRWNDPSFAFAWPDAPAVISERDANYPDFPLEQN
ncbi:MAG TPA: dTDP-4-dehydrorhamnose 3,5-epimerase family protein [Beijerinckiaceae bacterium]|jgi:dTDP-4-dehydrorhamnose 3,5-epimerase|nr:dTDP-4-dehydrorhamnose 3,5-epimerase family protein [Beijerinckiaceae bacterium]